MQSLFFFAFWILGIYSMSLSRVKEQVAELKSLKEELARLQGLQEETTR